MTSLYAVIIADRHIDVDVEIFKHKHQAINYLKHEVAEDSWEEQECPDGWEFFMSNPSSQEDYAFVIKKEIKHTK